MSIKDILEKIKPFYNILLIVVIAVIFFGLGRISALEGQKTPIKILYPNNNQTGSVVNSSADGGLLQNTQTTGEGTILVTPEVVDTSGVVVASKNGTKYYFPWCGTVKVIKPENLIKFESIEAARAAGYTPAANCKGLK